MDLTEALRGDEFSKTDFFDFVTCPDLSDGSRPKSYSYGASNGELEGLSEMKETNNNHVSSECLQFEQLWSNTPVVKEKEPTKLDGTFLDDLQKFLAATPEDQKPTTDGAIYTLTVLNGDHSWLKTEDAVHPHVSPSHAVDINTGQPPPMELDSLFHIINVGDSNGVHYPTPNSASQQPEAGGNNTKDDKTLAAPNLPPPNYHYHMVSSGCYVKREVRPNNAYQSPSPTESTCINTRTTPTTSSSATSAITSSNNCSNSNSSTSSSSSILSPTNSNGQPSPPSGKCLWSGASSGAESLLRSALQGKAPFPAAVPYSDVVVKKEPGSDSHSELRRALSAPPGNNQFPPSPNTYTMTTQEPALNGSNSNGGEPDPIFPGEDDPGVTSSPLVDPSGPLPSMDELILSHLDTFSPGDYERFKRLEKEVAESAKHFCNGAGSNSSSSSSSQQNGGLYLHEMAAADFNQNVYLRTDQEVGIIMSPQEPPPTPTNPMPSKTSSNSSRKYSKRQNGKNSPAVNGVRKERSLHYCTICNKGFKDKYSVNVHIRTHTGEKPFSCTLCGKNFRQKAHLAKHYQTHAQKAANQQKSVKR